MTEYRARITTTPFATNSTPKTPKKSTPNYFGIRARYGLDDDMNIGSQGGKEQSVEAEYNSYVSAPLAHPSTDILKFWEVSGNHG
jgi:hypothetical protein